MKTGLVSALATSAILYGSGGLAEGIQGIPDAKRVATPWTETLIAQNSNSANASGCGRAIINQGNNATINAPCTVVTPAETQKDKKCVPSPVTKELSIAKLDEITRIRDIRPYSEDVLSWEIQCEGRGDFSSDAGELKEWCGIGERRFGVFGAYGVTIGMDTRRGSVKVPGLGPVQDLNYRPVSRHCPIRAELRERNCKLEVTWTPTWTKYDEAIFQQGAPSRYCSR